MKKKHGLALAIMISIATTSIFSFADTATELNKQLDATKNKQKSLNAELQETKKKEGQVLEKLQAIEEEISKSEEEIESLKGKITTTEREIKNTLETLEAAEEKINEKQDIMYDRLNVMYKNGTIGYAEVILNSKSITDLLTNLDMVKKIVNHDVDLLKEMKEQRDLIEEQKVSLENQKRQLVNLKASVEQKQKMLVVSRGEQERYRAELAKDKVAIEKALDQVQKQADALTNEIRKLQSSGAYVGGELQWPFSSSSRISSPFGNRIHPILKVKKFHSGIDIPAPSGVAVVAAGSGKVVSSGTLGSYGRTVIIDHGGGIMTLYAHNSKLLVSVGDTVTKGQKIALIGSTGASTGPHLHFEVRKNGQYMGPSSICERKIDWQ